MNAESFVRSRKFIILMGALTAFDPLTIDMYLPAFSEIQKTFQTSISQVELSISTFFVGMAVGQLFYGPLADRFGRRKPLVGGMLLYFIATLGCAFAPNIGTFIFLRLLQALGGCAGMVITRAVIRDLFDKKQVATFLSNMALIMGLAPILAPTIGSVINQFCGWRAIFLTLACANLVCMTMISIYLPETSPMRSSNLKFKSVFRSYWGLLKNREFIGYLIPDMALRAGMFAYIAGSPFVFIELLGIPASQYGYVFGFNGLGLMLASQVNRRLLAKWPPETLLKWGVTVAFIAGIFVFLASWSVPTKWMLLGFIFTYLATLNFVSPNSLAGALASQGHQAGTASALYGCLQWSMATASSFLVSYFHNGTAFPMTTVILFYGALAWIGYTFLARRKIP